MWLITVKPEGDTHRWDNKKHHDFLQFVPAELSRRYGREITKDDLEIEYIGDIHRNECLEYSDGEFKKLVRKNGKVELHTRTKKSRVDIVKGETGDEIRTETPEKFKKDKEIITKALKKWPYSNVLNKKGRPTFLGNEVEGD